MGRARTYISASARARGLREYTDPFRPVFGTKRGSDRIHDEIAPTPADLPFRKVDTSKRTRERVYAKMDALVSVCEKCGGEDFLKRDYNDKDLPALCGECCPPDMENDCEEWCSIELDHTGLCRPGF
jgi:hypothetical protein